jgi:hypothetical protein
MTDDRAVPVGAAPGREAKPHDTRLVVWDVPAAVECGAAFRVRVGVKCAAGCRPAWRAEVRDHDGNPVAIVAVGDTPWHGTVALYHAEIELLAPAAAGLYPWSVHVAAVDTDEMEAAPHRAATAKFNLRTVPAPECLLKVIAVDAASQTPVQGAKVVVHPYRGSTDVHGIAEIRVPKGEYRLFVSGPDHFPFRSDGKVEADTTIRAELDPDLGPTDAELWS